jgi:hypothetical protein
MMGSSPIQSTVYTTVHSTKESNMNKSIKGTYIAHTGTQVWITAEATGGGATDALVFSHIHMNPTSLNTMLEGKVITIKTNETGLNNIYFN